jgi:Meckel syndrome type 1 protein
MTDTDDDLQQLYGQALAHDERRPDGRVRKAVLSHAQMTLDAAADTQVKTVVSKPMFAANLPSWKAALVASLLLTPLIGILVSQHQERLTVEDGVSARAPSSTDSPALTQPVPQPAAAPMTSKTDPVGGEATARTRQASNETALKQAVKTAPAAEKRATINQMVADDVSAKATATAPAKYSQSNVVQTAPPTVTGATAALATTPAEREAGVASPVARTKSGTPQAMVQETSKLAAPAPQSGELADLNVLFFQAVRAGKITEIEAMLVNGTSVNVRDASGKTALIWAAQVGNEGLVQQLLALGANRDLVDGEGLTALQHAQKKGNNRIITLLVLPP